MQKDTGTIALHLCVLAIYPMCPGLNYGFAFACVSDSVCVFVLCVCVSKSLLCVCVTVCAPPSPVLLTQLSGCHSQVMRL